MLTLVTLAIVTAVPALISSARAQSFGSSYTSTAEKHCRITHTGQDGSVSVCPGKAGLIVLVTEDDMRQTVSVGRNRKTADNEPAASASFEPFNSTNSTVEWRAMDCKPFAIIQRWLIADNDAPDKDGCPTDEDFLVVTRLPPGGVCHVAYVHIAANPDPNEIARDFKCGKDEVRFVGARGRAAELAKRREDAALPSRQIDSKLPKEPPNVQTKHACSGLYFGLGRNVWVSISQGMSPTTPMATAR